MPTRTVIPQIVGQPVKVQITALDDADETTIVSVVHGDANPSFSESYAHTKAGAIRSLGRDAVLGKVDSAGGRRFRDGTFRQYVSEADQVVNAPGSSVDICYYDTPGMFPAQGVSGATIDAQARADIAALKAQVSALQAALAVHESRLDRSASAVIVAGQAMQG